MQQCKHCENEQESGKFCERCGNPFDENFANEEIHKQQEQTSATQAVSGQEQNDALGKAKNFGKDYLDDLMEVVKNPTSSFKQSNEKLLSGIISLVLVALTVTLGFYFWLNGIYKEAMSGWGTMGDEVASLPFFELFFRGFLGVALFLAVGLVAAIVPLLFMQKSIKAPTLITQYGLLSMPFIALGVFTMLAGLIGGMYFPAVMVVITIGLFIIAAPAIMITYHLTKQNENGQVFYAGLAGIAISAFLTYLIFDNYISSLMDRIAGI